MIKNCEVCGKAFEALQKKKKYCSQECYKEASRERVKQGYYRFLHKEPPADVEKDALALRRLDGGESICMWCEKPVADPHQHFCSDGCLLQFYEKIFGSLQGRGLQ